MSDTVVVMNRGDIQQIGSPQDIYNEPNNAFVADFIGESNILDGVMLRDFRVELPGRNSPAVTRLGSRGDRRWWCARRTSRWCPPFRAS